MSGRLSQTHPVSFINDSYCSKHIFACTRSAKIYQQNLFGKIMYNERRNRQETYICVLAGLQVSRVGVIDWLAEGTIYNNVHKKTKVTRTNLSCLDNVKAGNSFYLLKW